MMNIMREKRGEKDEERDDAHGVAVEEYVSVRGSGYSSFRVGLFRD